MMRLTFRIFAVATLVSVFITQSAHAQISSSGSSVVSTGSPISGFLTDAAANTIEHDITTTGALFFGSKRSTSSELGGVQQNFGTGGAPFESISTLKFDNTIESRFLGQTPVLTTGANFGAELTSTSDAGSAKVIAGSQGMGVDGSSNLDNVVSTDGDVTADLASTFNDEAIDWSR
ncbi:hypothetical protein N9L06_06255 [Mariniblastus sp.]|nr:hypothetical protein [Mariniblastus sp.]